MLVKNNVTLAVVKYFFATGSIQWLSDIFAGLLLQLTNISHGERLSGGGGVSFVAIQVGVVGTIFFFVFLYMAEGKQRKKKCNDCATFCNNVLRKIIELR